MRSFYREKAIEADLCHKCPARNGELFTAKLRGSSFRRRLIEEGEEFSIDHCLIAVGEICVANIQLANNNVAAADQDVETIRDAFETRLPACHGPEVAQTDDGTSIFCAPINAAVDQFIRINYPH